MYFANDFHRVSATGLLNTSTASDIAFIAVPVSGANYIPYQLFVWSVASTGLGGINVPFNVYTSPNGAGAKCFLLDQNVNISTSSGLAGFTASSSSIIPVGSGLFVRHTSATPTTGLVGISVALIKV